MFVSFLKPSSHCSNVIGKTSNSWSRIFDNKARASSSKGGCWNSVACLTFAASIQTRPTPSTSAIIMPGASSDSGISDTCFVSKSKTLTFLLTDFMGAPGQECALLLLEAVCDRFGQETQALNIAIRECIGFLPHLHAGRHLKPLSQGLACFLRLTLRGVWLRTR